MKNFIKENWFKISIIIILLVVSLSCLLSQFAIYKNNKNEIIINRDSFPKLPNCDFEIVEGETYKGYFDNSNRDNYDESKNSGMQLIQLPERDNQYWITYTGTIKNKSNERQYLEAMMLKMYDKNDVYIDDQFDMKQDWIEPNKLFSYELHLRSTKVDIRDESSTKVDIYPWFKTCE